MLSSEEQVTSLTKPSTPLCSAVASPKQHWEQEEAWSKSESPTVHRNTFQMFRSRPELNVDLSVLLCRGDKCEVTSKHQGCRWTISAEWNPEKPAQQQKHLMRTKLSNCSWETRPSPDHSWSFSRWGWIEEEKNQVIPPLKVPYTTVSPSNVHSQHSAFDQVSHRYKIWGKISWSEQPTSACPSSASHTGCDQSSSRCSWPDQCLSLSTKSTCYVLSHWLHGGVVTWLPAAGSSPSNCPPSRHQLHQTLLHIILYICCSHGLTNKQHFLFLL